MRKTTFILLMFLATTTLCCSTTDHTFQDLPEHCHVVCDTLYDGNLVTEIFDSWVRGAIARAGSSFMVWAVGHDRHSYHRLFLVRIPDTWGPNVMQAKTAFMQACRDHLGNLTLSSPLEQQFRFTSQLLPDAYGRHDVHVLSKTIAFQNGPANMESRRPLHTAVISDCSSSMHSILEDQNSAVQDAFDEWMRKGGNSSTSTFSTYVVGQSYATTRQSFFVAVPRVMPGEQIAYLLGARRELLQSGVGSAGDNASAVAEALNVAVQDMRGRSGDYEILMLSDMRQVTPEAWNFEQAVPDVGVFLSWLKREGLDADLSGISITVCGLHHSSSPEASVFSARLYTDIQRFWKTVFQKLGAEEMQFFTRYDRTVLSSR